MNVTNKNENTFPSSKQHKRNVSKHLIALAEKNGAKHETPWDYQKRGNAQSDAFFESDLWELLQRTSELELQNSGNALLKEARKDLEQLLCAVHLLQNGAKAPAGGREAMFDRCDKVRDSLETFK